MPVGKWNLAKLLEVFSKELTSKERCQPIKSSEPSSQIIGNQGLNSDSVLHVASENHNQNPPKITCPYCRQNHPSNRCRVVTDVLRCIYITFLLLIIFLIVHLSVNTTISHIFYDFL